MVSELFDSAFSGELTGVTVVSSEIFEDSVVLELFDSWLSDVTVVLLVLFVWVFDCSKGFTVLVDVITLIVDLSPTLTVIFDAEFSNFIEITSTLHVAFFPLLLFFAVITQVPMDLAVTLPVFLSTVAICELELVHSYEPVGDAVSVSDVVPNKFNTVEDLLILTLLWSDTIHFCESLSFQSQILILDKFAVLPLFKFSAFPVSLDINVIPLSVAWLLLLYE